MGLVAALIASLKAAAAYLQYVAPLKMIRNLEEEIADYEDEILRLGLSGSAADKLRIETLARRKQRARESLRALRSAYGDSDAGD